MSEKLLPEEKKNHRNLQCRFKFPKAPQVQSTLTKIGDDWVLLLKRNDSILNNRNDLVLQNWRATIDWSPIISKEKVLRYAGKNMHRKQSRGRNLSWKC